MEESLGLSSRQTVRLMPPLNMLLGDSGNPVSLDELIAKLTAVCRTNSKFLQCIRECPDQSASEILIKGQTAWITICKTFNLYSDPFKTSVLICWARYGNKMSMSCTAEEAELESAFLRMAANGRNNVQNYTALLCRSVVQHDLCYVNQVRQHCDRTALRFFLQLSERSFAYVSLFVIVVDPATNDSLEISVILDI
ncbi:unnamed protein product [Enterobius vermicularis]|uniref:NR LBD domain-containing protein n=1 Tax=Enterobius vermicularis TaxID=51028 RepID=A0A0N4VLN8_ENTVE|nr:unnamed protein product [Enterobius vermicularis]